MYELFSWASARQIDLSRPVYVVNKYVSRESCLTLNFTLRDYFSSRELRCLHIHCMYILRTLYICSSDSYSTKMYFLIQIIFLLHWSPLGVPAQRGLLGYISSIRELYFSPSRNILTGFLCLVILVILFVQCRPQLRQDLNRCYHIPI